MQHKRCSYRRLQAEAHGIEERGSMASCFRTLLRCGAGGEVAENQKPYAGRAFLRLG
jgi:hypothetical protein